MGKPDIYNGLKNQKKHLETNFDIRLTLIADLSHHVCLLCDSEAFLFILNLKEDSFVSS